MIREIIVSCITVGQRSAAMTSRNLKFYAFFTIHKNIRLKKLYYFYSVFYKYIINRTFAIN